MPLYDRKCINCGYLEEDLIECPIVDNAIPCPKCRLKTHVRQISIPGLVYLTGSPDSALEMGRALDTRRDKSAAGHGNTTIKMSTNDRGECTIDGIDKSKY